MRNKIKKVKLMNKVGQMVILDAPKYMITEIKQVYEDITGLRTGMIKPTNTPVIYDKHSDVWRLAV